MVERGLREAGYSLKDICFAIQIHDELMYLVRDELVEEVIPIIKAKMEFNVKSWTVQLTVTPKVGKIWGMQKELVAP